MTMFLIMGLGAGRGGGGVIHTWFEYPWTIPL